jgi:hypothetical protein
MLAEEDPQPEDTEIGKFLIFKMDEKLFKFRGDNILPGQYAFPFTF